MKPISFPLFPKGIMICKLDVDQSIDLTGTIRKGYGREHEMVLCFYYFLSRDFTIKNQEKDSMKHTKKFNSIVSGSYFFRR